MLTSDKILRKIARYKKRIEKYGVKRIGLFGSYARDEHMVSSDIDFIVEFEKGKATLDNFMNLQFFLEKLFGKRVDLLTAEGVRSIRIEAVRKSIEERAIYG
ncbi:MAG: nucleotidyltransferase family protein [Candidatus Aenigmarchaeota archaeon]|nr:nucleotidyltransferase family protein [Candidatus Aenigmarchaeota archaeon]